MVLAESKDPVVPREEVNRKGVEAYFQFAGLLRVGLSDGAEDFGFLTIGLEAFILHGQSTSFAESVSGFGGDDVSFKAVRKAPDLVPLASILLWLKFGDSGLLLVGAAGGEKDSQSQ